MGKCYGHIAKEHVGWGIVVVSLETQSTARGTNANARIRQVPNK